MTNNTTSNSEATRAQGDETVDEPDPEATEHDVSTATADPNSESALQVKKFRFFSFVMGVPTLYHMVYFQTGDDGNEDFDEIMDQLLERDMPNQADPPILADVITSERHSITESEDVQHDSQVRIGGTFIFN